MKPQAKVKICGVTRPEQAREIALLGSDYLGINFWPKSSRFVDPSTADWLLDLPANCIRVGVFVNPTSEQISDVAKGRLVQFFQLHGDETPEFCGDLIRQGLSIIKAVRVRDAADLDIIAQYPVTDVLLDAFQPGSLGGTGISFPWELAIHFKKLYPDRRLWLAGGLNPENVADAVDTVQPYAVDVASGVESGIPGIKDLSKVGKFLRQARHS